MEALSVIDIAQKPSQICGTCLYAPTGSGFCPDWWPRQPKLAVLMESPSDSDITAREPLAGSLGSFFMHYLIEPLGWTRSDVAFCNTIRCRCSEGKYPQADLKLTTQRHCRSWDGVQNKDLASGGLDAYEPNYFLVSFAPRDIVKTWSLLQVAQRDFGKAQRLAEGRRLLVLLGDTAKQLVVPQLKDGGLSKWRGHHGPLNWPEVRKRWA